MIFLFFLYLKIQFSKNQIILQFERHWGSLPITKENLFENLYRNQLITKLNIGSLKQEIPLNIRLHSYTSFLISNEVNETNLIKYDNTKSSSFNLISKNPIKFSSLPFNLAYTFEDTFYLNNTICEKLPFILVSELSKYKNKYNVIEGGILGFQRINNNVKELDDYNFISLLYKNKLINFFGFSFKYTDNDKGELIIGKYPHEYDNNYKEKNFLKSKVQKLSDVNTWGFIFDVAFIGNNIIEENSKGDLNIESGFIIAIQKYYFYVLKIFFNDKIEEGKCFKEIFHIDEREFYFFSCDDNVDVSLISTLTLSLKEIEMNITFNESDLWYKFEGKKYYLILFQPYGNIWHLGKPFFKKYQVVFDQDKSVFGFYNLNYEKPSYFNKNWIIVFLLICITIILICYIINYFLKTPRRKRVNELIEDVDYTTTE